jgi:hypothetical protein
MLRRVSYKTRHSRTKKRISGSCRCICRKTLVGRRVCNDITLYSFVGVARRESSRDRTSRPWNFEAEFPLGSKGHPSRAIN